MASPCVIAAPPTATNQRVVANGTVNVRSSAAGPAIGQQYYGALGDTKSGPVTASLNGASLTWWNVNFDSGVDGWVASIGIDRVTTTPAPAPTVSGVSPNSVTGSTSPRTFTISGSNFVSGAKVQVAWGTGGYAWVDTSTNATFVNASTLTVPINTQTTVDTWRVRVRNPDGQTSSGYVTFTVTAAAAPAPTVSGVSPNSVTGSTSPRTFTISGSNFASGAKVQVAWGTGGYIWQDTSTNATFVNASTLTVPINTQTTVDTWRVRVRNPDGQTSSSYVTFTVSSSGILPPPVTNAPGTFPGPGSMVSNLTPAFTWNTVTGAERYSMVVSKHPYGAVNAVYQNHYLTGNSFTIPSGVLTPGTLYRWQLGAINSTGHEGTSSDLRYFQTPATNQAPVAPSNLVAILDNQGVASIAWSDNSNNETGFRIERRAGSATWTEISTTATNVAAAFDFTVTAGNAYRYRVSAFNGAGYSAPSPEVLMDFPATGALSLLITAPTSSTTWSAGDSRQITWMSMGNTQNIGFIGVYYSLNGGSGYTSLQPTQSGGSHSMTWQIPSNFASSASRIKVVAFSASGVQLATHETANFNIISSASKPTARPDVNNLGPVQGSAVKFTGAASTAPAGRTISSYQWTLGDGTNRSGLNISHSYANVGSYTATLTVTDSAGQSHSSSLSIRVSGKSLGAENPSSYFADPVNLATGNFILEATDIEIPGMGFPLKFSRFYNSKDTIEAGVPIGHGWTHSYHLKLTEGTGGVVTIRHGDGRRETHNPDGSGGYSPEPGVRDRLQKISPTRFVLTSKDQMTHTFDGGLFVSLTDRNNNTQTLTYQSGRLSNVTDSSGRFLTFSYNAQGRLSEVRDRLDRTVGYDYSAGGELLTVTNPRGGKTRYTYDAFHQILTAEDPKGNIFVTNEYDAQQRVVNVQRDAFGNLSKFQYDFVTGLTTVTDPFNQVTKHLHDDKLRLVAMTNELDQTEHYEYDEDNNRTAVISRNGKTTRYHYDSSGNVTAKIDPLQRRTIIQYNSRNDPVRRFDAIGFGRSMSGQHGGGYSVDFEYDTRGNLLRSVDAKGKITEMAYNAAGKLLSIKDRRGNTTRHEYDAAGNRVKTIDALNQEFHATFDAVGRMRTSRNARNHTMQFDYDESDNLLAVRNPLNETIVHEYDPNGNRTLTRDAKGAETRFEYDAKDRLLKVTDAENGVVRHEYDAYDRKTKTIDARGKETRFEYDPAGRLKVVIDPLGNRTLYGYDANGNRTTVTDPLGKVTRSAYNALDQLVSVTDPLGNITTFEYDELGRKTRQVDALKRATRSEYDDLGRLIKVTDAAGGTVIYLYDENGNRVRTTNPRGKATNSTFDKLNRLIRRDEPGSTERYEYDEVGNRTKRTDAKGQVVTYQYDAADRLHRINYPTGSPIVFTYDLNGKPLTMKDGIGTTSYEYDKLGRMTRYQNPFGHVVRYEYDANSNRTAMIYPGNKRVEYEYDSSNRMTSVKDWNNRLTRYQYDTANRLVTTLNPNGTSTTQSYDHAGRLATLSNRGPGNAVINEYAYTLDAVGNHVKVQQNEPVNPSPNLGTFSYTYDHEDRIENMEGIIQKHDANGNLIGAGPDVTLGYDFENRLVNYRSGSLAWNWKYDGAGRRLEYIEGGIAFRYVLDVNTPLPNVIMEVEDTGDVFMYYIYGLGLVSQIDASGASRYYHYDSRGSTIAITNSTGKPVSSFAYDPFGRMMGQQPDSTIDRFMYLGRHGVINDYNGFHYIRARHYSVRRGRFLQKDPFLGFEDQSQSLNRYVYALNNPPRMIDVSGFSAREALSLPASNRYSTDLENRLLMEQNASLTSNSTAHFVEDDSDGRHMQLISGLAGIGSGLIAGAGGVVTALPGITTAVIGGKVILTGAGAPLGVQLVGYGSAQALPGVLMAVSGGAEFVLGTGEIYGYLRKSHNPFEGTFIDKLSIINEGFR